MSEAGDGFTIDDLAARAGMTVRNVRAHLSRGLLHAGDLRGRTSYYGPAHLARLELISGLQRRGFSLAAIGVLIERPSAGGAEESLRLYREMLAPWEPEEPVEMAEDEFPDWLGVTLPDAAVQALRAGSGSVEQAGPGRLRVTNPSVVRAGARAVAIGIPAAAIIDLGVSLQERTRGIAELFVALFREHLWNPHVAAGLPRSGAVEVRTAVEALQPVATQALLGSFRTTMQQTMDSFVAELSEDLARPR